MKLSFIIVNYRSEKYLEKCVISIINSARNANFEVIIVNNEEKALDRISQNHNSFFDLKVVEMSENVGFGRACNAGAQAASGDLLCFLNPDAEIVNFDAKKIINDFKTDHSIGIIGPRILGTDGNTQWWSVGKGISPIDLIVNKLGFPRSRSIWKSDSRRSVDWVTGAALFSKKDVFEEVNGFDENFFLYFEDVDLCRRVRAIGKKVVYLPHFHIRHIGGKSADSKENQKEHYYKSQDYYFEKHFGRTTSRTVRFLRKLLMGNGKN